VRSGFEHLFEEKWREKCTNEMDAGLLELNIKLKKMLM
jgi:hypothetical protein